MRATTSSTRCSPRLIRALLSPGPAAPRAPAYKRPLVSLPFLLPAFPTGASSGASESVWRLEGSATRTRRRRRLRHGSPPLLLRNPTDCRRNLRPPPVPAAPRPRSPTPLIIRLLETCANPTYDTCTHRFSQDPAPPTASHTARVPSWHLSARLSPSVHRSSTSMTRPTTVSWPQLTVSGRASTPQPISWEEPKLPRSRICGNS